MGLSRGANQDGRRPVPVKSRRLIFPFTDSQVCGQGLKDGSDDVLPTRNRSGVITLPNKAAASGAQHASSCRKYTPPRPNSGYFFPKPRCARQVEHSRRQGAVRYACKPMNKVTTLPNRSLFGPMCFIIAAAMPSSLDLRHRRLCVALRDMLV